MKGKEALRKGLVVKSGDIALSIRLYPTATAERIWEIAPFSSHANRWGEEVYFTIPLSLGLEENARNVLEKGESFKKSWTKRANCIEYLRVESIRGLNSVKLRKG